MDEAADLEKDAAKEEDAPTAVLAEKDAAKEEAAVEEAPVHSTPQYAKYM
jgi:hypothetical protein